MSNVTEPVRSDVFARAPGTLLRAIRDSQPEYRYASNAELIRIALSNLLGSIAGDGAHSESVR